MLALCLMLLVTYYALNYAGIIGLGLVGVEAVMILSKRVREVNIQTRLRVDKEAWPPQPRAHLHHLY